MFGDNIEVHHLRLPSHGWLQMSLLNWVGGFGCVEAIRL